MLYASRAGYNLIVLTFFDIENINSLNYDWYVSDQVRHNSLSSPSSIFILGFLILILTSPSRLEVLAGRWRLCGVWGHCVHLGPAAHITGGLFLPCPSTSTGKGQCSTVTWHCHVTVMWLKDAYILQYSSHQIKKADLSGCRFVVVLINGHLINSLAEITGVK